MFQDGVDDGPDLLAEDQGKVSAFFILDICDICTPSSFKPGWQAVQTCQNRNIYFGIYFTMANNSLVFSQKEDKIGYSREVLAYDILCV